jgi:hypothetical protein
MSSSRRVRGLVGLRQGFRASQQRLVDDIGQATLQTPQGFPAGLALGLLAGQVGARSRVVAGLGERGEVQRPVEPTVAAPVQTSHVLVKSSGDAAAVAPGEVLVVGGVGAQAAVEDADQAIGDSSQGTGMGVTGCAAGVIQGPGAG